ncbi:hypothetical protein PSEWESI4_00940 [Pseudomonas carbonaria]|uniref:Type VI secretion system secreted protein VgrG n=1 Tax=Zestomonas carbonaria TaxID=2762745 RepID=A0A7U7EKE9_9GAMM|nr:hypothetical protein PSEWESI4_00940 [Pseudomonas carbonaria]
MAQNWAGGAWGHLAIPRIGHEVIVDFLDGDPDQPIVTGRTYHVVNRPPYKLPALNTLATVKSKEHQGDRANELRIDDTHGEISAALMSEHGRTELHLGYLTHPRPNGGEPRGEGFELRTDEHGAVRAAKGLLLSSEAQLQANGGQLDRAQVVQVLEAALHLARSLGEHAGDHQGIGHDPAPQQVLSEAVRDLGHGANDEPGGGNGGEPAIALSGPAGIAAATPRSLGLAAGQHIDSVAEQHQQITAGEKVVINAGSDIGLFAKGGDMRHIAQQGELLMQAQHNDIKVQADQSVEISASRQHILVNAKEHITLLCGGAYLKMQGGNIELGMPGDFTVKAGSHNFVGPGNADASLPIFKSPRTFIGDYDAHFRLRKLDERAFQGYRYRLMSGGQLLTEGFTNDDGETELIKTERGLPIQAYKTVMREDQRITERWQANIATIDSDNPNYESAGPFNDESFLEEYGEEIGYSLQLSSPEYRIRQVAYLPVEGIGVNGTFFLKGNLSLEGQSLFVSAMGHTAAKNMGSVQFHATAAIEVNGKQVSSTPLQLGKEPEAWPVEDYSPIGSTTLVLPPPTPNDAVQIKISGGYIYSAPEGRATPMPSTGSVTIPLTIVKKK